MKLRSCLILFCITLLFGSCEKVIPVKLDEGTSQLTIDAFIDSDAKPQKIRLTKTGGYFDNVPNNNVSGAIVKITDNEGRIFNFLESSTPGDYIWTPLITDTLVKILNTYTLSITSAGEQFQASSVAYPVPKIDSVTYLAKVASSGQNKGKVEYTGAFYATDIAGTPNFYWVKSYLNGVFYGKPENINLSQDGAFAGGGTDGLSFILPIREAIFPRENKIMPNDSITVNLYALNPETYNFLNEVLSQTTNSGLFATPPSNVSTNIRNVNTNSTTKAIGWFNIGQIKTNGVRIK
jgi:Domain of unknown function (DUF4249)